MRISESDLVEPCEYVLGEISKPSDSLGKSRAWEASGPSSGSGIRATPSLHVRATT